MQIASPPFEEVPQVSRLVRLVSTLLRATQGVQIAFRVHSLQVVRVYVLNALSADIPSLLPLLATFVHEDTSRPVRHAQNAPMVTPQVPQNLHLHRTATCAMLAMVGTAALALNVMSVNSRRIQGMSHAVHALLQAQCGAGSVMAMRSCSDKHLAVSVTIHQHVHLLAKEFVMPDIMEVQLIIVVLHVRQARTKWLLAMMALAQVVVRDLRPRFMIRVTHWTLMVSMIT